MKFYFIYANEGANQNQGEGYTSAAAPDQPLGRFSDRHAAQQECDKLNLEKGPGHPGYVVEERDVDELDG